MKLDDPVATPEQIQEEQATRIRFLLYKAAPEVYAEFVARAVTGDFEGF